MAIREDEDTKPNAEIEDDVETGQEDEAESDEDGDEVEDAEDGDEQDHGEETDDRQTGRSRERETEDVTPRKRGASEVIRENKKRAKEATAKAEEALRRAEAAERRAEAAERATQARVQTETAQQRADRLALMSPEERFDALRSEDRAAHAAEMNSVKFQIWDSTDSAKFERLAEKDALVARVADRVEARFAELQRQGSPVSRAILADLEIGKMMRENQKSAKTKQTRRAEEGVRRETVKPKRVTSDASSTRGRRGQEDTPDARRRRLEDVIL